VDKSTERFLQLMEAQNARIAAYNAEHEHETTSDPVRLQREAERREKWGQLRAREHPSRHPTRARRVFPYIDVS
jgi:hypothetical protein